MKSLTAYLIVNFCLGVFVAFSFNLGNKKSKTQQEEIAKRLRHIEYMIACGAAMVCIAYLLDCILY